MSAVRLQTCRERDTARDGSKLLLLPPWKSGKAARRWRAINQVTFTQRRKIWEHLVTGGQDSWPQHQSISQVTG